MNMFFGGVEIVCVFWVLGREGIRKCDGGKKGEMKWKFSFKGFLRFVLME